MRSLVLFLGIVGLAVIPTWLCEELIAHHMEVGFLPFGVILMVSIALGILVTKK